MKQESLPLYFLVYFLFHKYISLGTVGFLEEVCFGVYAFLFNSLIRDI